MEIFSFIIIVIFIIGVIKLRSLDDKLTSVSRKLDSLQYTLNDFLCNGQRDTPAKALIEPLKLEVIPLVKEEILKVKTKHSFMEEFQKRFKIKSLEDFFIGNLLLNVSIIAFVLGIGFFLKYSIDQNWIPIWGRVLIGIAIAIAMLYGGIRTVKNSHKLFSESLFGGGIAILYLSIFAGFAIEEFAFLSFPVAFGFMIIITILSGVISTRFNSITTAVFGLIGGFATPFLINSGQENIQSLMIYILILNLGVLYIAISKKWSLLNWLAFILTILTELGAVYKSTEIFYFLVAIFFVLFIIYSIVPFINEIRLKDISLNPKLVMLFGINLLAHLAILAQLFISYDINFTYFSIVTILLAIYLLGYAYYLKKRGVFAQNLFFAILAQAIGLLLVTPAILFKGEILSAVWAIEAAILLFIAQKSAQKSFLLFGFLGLILSFFRYLGVNISDAYYLLNAESYFQDLMRQTITALLVIGAFFVSCKFQYNNSLQKIADDYRSKDFIMGAGVFLLFVFLNVEIANIAKLFFPKAQQIATTLLWVLFGISMFVISLSQNIQMGKKVAMGLIFIAILKAFFIDLTDVDAIYRIVLFIMVGVLLFVLAYYYKKKSRVL